MSVKLTRRQTLYLIGGIAATAAVGGGLLYWLNQTPAASQPQTPSGQAKKITGKLTILGRSAYHVIINRNLMDTFSKKYPDVALEYVPKGYSDEYQTIVLSMRNKSSDYDVLYMDEPWVPYIVRNGWLLPIENPDLSDYPEGIKSWPTLGGKVYGLAITGNVNFLIYRADILKDLGESPPETWDDVLRIAKKVKSKYTDIGAKIYGFSGNAVKGDAFANDVFPAVLYPFGGRYFAEDGVTPALKSKEAVEALEFLRELRPYTHPRTTEWTSLTEYSEAILRGEVAIGVVWSGWIVDVDNPQKSQVVGKIEAMPYPRQKTNFGAQTGVWYYAVSAFSRNPDAAMEFVKVVTSAEAQRRAALEAGLPPTRLSVFDDPEYKKRFRLAGKLREVLAVAKPVRTNVLWMDMVDQVGTYLYLGYIGQLDPADAVAKAQEEMVKVASAKA